MRNEIQALRDLLVHRPMEVVTPLAIFAVTLAVGYLVRRIVLGALAAWHKRTASRPGMILTEALRGPLVIWILILAVHLAIEASSLPAKFTRWSPRARGNQRVNFAGSENASIAK